MKEATARIKINKLLEAAGWRFFSEGNAPANIRLEPSVTIKPTELNALGDNFEKSTKGFVDFLLLDARGFPLLVLEAKAEDKNPLVGKEQARKYAKSQNCRFVMLSNGNARAVFDYFIGYKLGLTATPRDYLRRFDSSKPGTRDPREAERRLLLDTYGRGFGVVNLSQMKKFYLFWPAYPILQTPSEKSDFARIANYIKDYVSLNQFAP